MRPPNSSKILNLHLLPHFSTNKNLKCDVNNSVTREFQNTLKYFQCDTEECINLEIQKNIVNKSQMSFN